MKDIFIQTRVDERLKARLIELQRATGLNRAEVIRRLIETAEIASAPMPKANLGALASET